MSVTADIVQCTVNRPPAYRDACRVLAREQHLYCGDIVDQGCGSVEALAVTLWDSPTWYFWWE